MAYRTIIVGTDGSATAERAVVQAAGIARQHGARLIVVAAYDPHGGHSARPAEASEDLPRALTDRGRAEELARHGREAALDAGAKTVTVQTTAGSPADVLLEAAADFRADCIMVGSVGLSSAGHFVLGSVASSVAHHAPCDVLIVHTTA